MNRAGAGTIPALPFLVFTGAWPVRMRHITMRQRFKRNERLHEVALRSPWTFSAKLAVAGFVIGVLLVPGLLAGNPELEALGRTIHFLGWVFALGFAGIAVFRYFAGRREAEAGPAHGGENPTDEPPRDKDDA